jgi:molecular chaperone GrpE
VVTFLSVLGGKIQAMAHEKEEETDEQAATTATSGSESLTSSEPLNRDGELTMLREQVAAKEKEAKDHYDRYVRQVAELENFRKRTTRERGEAIRFANEELVKDLLPIVDNLERAVAHSKGGGNGKPLVEGVEMILKGLFDVLAKHGVIQISAVGQSFDPGKHEAIAQIETATCEPNMIVEEHHKGYLLRDRLLRPSLVTVAKTPISQRKKNDGTEVENEPGDD